VAEEEICLGTRTNISSHIFKFVCDLR